MRLNNISAEPGTVIGVHNRTKNFLVVERDDWFDKPFVRLREATPEESRPQAFKHEPRSVTEHRGIKRRMSVYGLIRQFAPTPTKVVKIEFPTGQRLNRQMRRAFKREGLI